MMSHVRVVIEFFNAHPKRFSTLQQKIKNLVPSARHNHLIDVCRTRWVARIDGLSEFIEVFIAIVNSLETIKDNSDENWSSDSVKEANGLSTQLSRLN